MGLFASHLLEDENLVSHRFQPLGGSYSVKGKGVLAKLAKTNFQGKVCRGKG